MLFYTGVSKEFFFMTVEIEGSFCAFLNVSRTKQYAHLRRNKVEYKNFAQRTSTSSVSANTSNKMNDWEQEDDCWTVFLES